MFLNLSYLCPNLSRPSLDTMLIFISPNKVQKDFLRHHINTHSYPFLFRYSHVGHHYSSFLVAFVSRHWETYLQIFILCWWMHLTNAWQSHPLFASPIHVRLPIMHCSMQPGGAPHDGGPPQGWGNSFQQWNQPQHGGPGGAPQQAPEPSKSVVCHTHILPTSTLFRPEITQY